MVAAADLIQRSRSSICQLKVAGQGQSLTGTGFVIEPRGQLVTCYHVAKPEWSVKNITAKFADGAEHRVVRPLWVDQATDLAVLELDQARPEGLQLGSTVSLRPGDEVVLLGYPTGTSVLSGFRGSVSAMGTNLLPRTPTELLQLDATVHRGNSGGPVLSLKTGLVVGVISMKYVPLFQEVQKVQRIVGDWPYRGQGQGQIRLMGIDFGALFNFLGKAFDAITGSLVNVSVGVGWAAPVEQIRRV